MQIFKMCSVTLYPLALISFKQIFIKITFNPTHGSHSNDIIKIQDFFRTLKQQKIMTYYICEVRPCT